MNRQTNNKIGHRRDEKSCIEIFEISAHEKLHFTIKSKVNGGESGRYSGGKLNSIKIGQNCDNGRSKN